TPWSAWSRRVRTFCSGFSPRASTSRTNGTMAGIRTYGRRGSPKEGPVPEDRTADDRGAVHLEALVTLSVAREPHNASVDRRHAFDHPMIAPRVLRDDDRADARRDAEHEELVPVVERRLHAVPGDARAGQHQAALAGFRTRLFSSPPVFRQMSSIRSIISSSLAASACSSDALTVDACFAAFQKWSWSS